MMPANGCPLASMGRGGEGLYLQKAGLFHPFLGRAARLDGKVAGGRLVLTEPDGVSLFGVGVGNVAFGREHSAFGEKVLHSAPHCFAAPGVFVKGVIGDFSTFGPIGMGRDANEAVGKTGLFGPAHCQDRVGDNQQNLTLSVQVQHGVVGGQLRGDEPHNFHVGNADVFVGDDEQPPPEPAVILGQELKRPIHSVFFLSAPDGFLKRRCSLEHVISVERASATAFRRGLIGAILGQSH